MTLVEISPRKVSAREAATMLGVSKSWLDKQRLLESGGPPHFRFGRRVVYDTRDLDEWAAKARRPRGA